MLTRLGIGLFWLLHFLPLRVLSAMGQAGGLLFLMLGRERREVTRTNLRLCFPEMGAKEREKLMREHYRVFGRAVLEASIVWWGSPARIRKLVRVEGEENFRALGDKRYIGLVPHFAGIEHLGLRMSMDRRTMAVYARQKNRIFDKFLLRVRTRFPGNRMVSRQEGVKNILRGFREGLYLQLSPDMDLGPRDSIFVPFFGFTAATVTALPRIAKLTEAAVVPIVVRQCPGAAGYEVRILPAWENYPTDDLEADIRRMNAFIEDQIRKMPEQYLWMHKRFKTRPLGEPRVYP